MEMFISVQIIFHRGEKKGGAHTASQRFATSTDNRLLIGRPLLRHRAP
jgi:hypothetical protein